MKPALLFKVCLLLVILFEFCKREDIQPSSNIILKNKNLPTIKANISGLWKMCYRRGGICGTCVFPAQENEFIDFRNGDWLKETVGVHTVNDSKIYWSYEKDIFAEYTFVIYAGGSGLIADRIFNDTLVIVDNTYDPMEYYLVRSR